MKEIVRAWNNAKLSLALLILHSIEYGSPTNNRLLRGRLAELERMRDCL
jgi:hypothetical protein